MPTVIQPETIEKSIAAPTHTKFNNLLWRDLINETCKEIDIENVGISAISPFGFELLNKKSFLNSSLRRFFIYIGIPDESGLNQKKVAHEFKEKLFHNLSLSNHTMLDDTVIIIENNIIKKLKPNQYTCLPTDKLINIQTRPVSSDILSDYADYLIASLAGTHNGTGEVKGYMENKKPRWRLYQLYIMQEYLFGSTIEPMTGNELNHYIAIPSVMSNNIQIFYEPSAAEAAPTEKEIDIILQLIKPRVSEMLRRVNPETNAKKKIITCSAYHFCEDKLKITLDQEVYQAAAETIKNTYMQFT